jgi:hypothetical protein
MIGATLFALLFIAAGGCVCWFTLSSILDYRRRVARSSLADGTVVSLREEGDEDVVYKIPIVRYTPAGRGDVKFESSLRRHPPKYKVGDRVKVFYNPHDPKHEAEILGGYTVYVVIAAVFGVPFVAIGIVVLVACVVRGACT